MCGILSTSTIFLFQEKLQGSFKATTKFVIARIAFHFFIDSFRVCPKHTFNFTWSKGTWFCLAFEYLKDMAYAIAVCLWFHRIRNGLTKLNKRHSIPSSSLSSLCAACK